MNAELRETERALDEAIVRLQFIRRHIGDLHELAFIQASTGEHAKSVKQHHYGDEVGRLDCRRLWIKVRIWLRLHPGRIDHPMQWLVYSSVALERILNDGTVDSDLKGTTVSLAEFVNARRAQKKRGKGHAQVAEQPNYPKGHK